MAMSPPSFPSPPMPMSATPSPPSNAVNITTNTTATPSATSSSSIVTSAALTSTSPSTAYSFVKHLHDKFDIVFNRVTTGRHDLKRMKAYLEERGEAEKVYARSIARAMVMQDITNSSGLNPVWSAMKDSAISLSKVHDDFAKLCQETVSSSLDPMIRDIKNTKTKLNTQFHKSVDDVKAKNERYERAKKACAESAEAACRAISEKDLALTQGVPNHQKKTMNAAKTSVANYTAKHEDYHKCAMALQAAQADYDKSIQTIMKEFEDLETTRLRNLVEQGKKYTQQHVILKQVLDSVIATLHERVTQVNVDDDIQKFISTNTTNSVPKSHLEFQPIKRPLIDAFIANPNGPNVPQATSAPPPPVSQFSAPVMHTPAASYPPVAPSPYGNGDFAIASYNFEATQADDLSFEAGDTIRLLECNDSDDWWKGEINGRIGIFPKSYVQKQGGGSNGAPESSNYPVPAPPAASVVTTAADQHRYLNGNPTNASYPAVHMETPAVAVDPAASAQNAAAVDDTASDYLQGQDLDIKCRALYDFEASEEDELSIQKDDILAVSKEMNGWYFGVLDRTGQSGIFPSNYVEKIS